MKVKHCSGLLMPKNQKSSRVSVIAVQPGQTMGGWTERQKGDDVWKLWGKPALQGQSSRKELQNEAIFFVSKYFSAN